MLSGNGRHRRPRQAPALLVAAGVTGSAMAIPLLSATGASAASGATWDRVAECESVGSWSANDGNGYYGGLQLTQDDWVKYGGLAYAPSADQASRSQQIAVGEKILADQGAGAWEACALLSGLGKDTGSANVDTGVVEGSASGSASESGSGSGLGLGSKPESEADSKPDSGSQSGSGSGSPSSSPSSSSSSSTPPASSSADSSGAAKASGSSRTPSPSAPAATGSRDSAESDVSPSPSSSSPSAAASPESDSSPIGVSKGGEQGKSGQGAGVEAGGTGAVATPGTGRHRGDAEGSYTVRTGDTLWSIADSLDLAGGWHGLFAENERSVGTDPDLILPGQNLAVGVEPVQK
ncbi:transglycosylase family protein [Streptomyces sp. NRRL WC-3618]|uniref:LysM peptidoglycan-binding domain-containing protein n=1 Tax=Streptomyces sp. NRRL WC-3618 TaxID=1519490 RepID=UPI00099CABCA|nr:transglycosylase family protein [Streptomyces sp. NRRL WC-3618]